MKNDEKLDQLLQHALSPKEEPGYWLNQKILRKAKEAEAMADKKCKRRVPATVMAAALVLVAGSITTVAAWKYLTPDKVAQEVEDQTLAEAFQSEGAVLINESQEYGGYKITLLGIVSGKNLSRFVSSNDAGEVKDDRTYVVTAIENADGSPRPSTSDDSYGKDPLFVSPLISMQDPVKFNIVTMDGAYSEFVQDGVQYRITESDNVELFADRALYLAVNDGVFYNAEAYQYHQDTGEITRNEAYEGVNALFQLPLDKNKADEKKAKEYIQKLEKEMDSPEGKATDKGQEGSLVSRIAKKALEWGETGLEQNAELLDGLTQTFSVDEEGYFSYSYEVKDDGIGSSGKILADSLFEEGQVGMSESMQIIGGETEQDVYIETFTRNEDGTVTLKVYHYIEG